MKMQIRNVREPSLPFMRPEIFGDRLNKHPGVLPESQDEEGQGLNGRQRAGWGGTGHAEEVEHHVVSMAQHYSEARISLSS